MRLSRLLLLALMIIPWFSLQLLGKKIIKRFAPSVIFMTMITQLLHSIAKRRNWWRFYQSALPKVDGSAAFTYGPEPITAFWLLKWTYGKFLLYILFNGLLHFLFAYPGMKLATRLGLSSLVRVTNSQFFLLLFSRAFLMYGFQMIKEKLFKKKLFR